MLSAGLPSTCVSGFALRFLVGFLVSCRLSFVRFPWTMPWLSFQLFFERVRFVSFQGLFEAVAEVGAGVRPGG